jgi:glycyl-tRNA synthetase beta chain
VTPDTFEAVFATRPTHPYDFHLRLLAVQSFRELPQADSLTIANKRIANILRQAGVSNPGRLEAHLLREPAERQLANKLIEAAGWISPLISRGDYTAALKELAGLRDSIDTFFDKVLVMCDDEALRNNRLALLGNLSSLFQKIADISRLQN